VKANVFNSFAGYQNLVSKSVSKATILVYNRNRNKLDIGGEL
jgi:hypothetical protein